MVSHVSDVAHGPRILFAGNLIICDFQLHVLLTKIKQKLGSLLSYKASRLFYATPLPMTTVIDVINQKTFLICSNIDV